MNLSMQIVIKQCDVEVAIPSNSDGVLRLSMDRGPIIEIQAINQGSCDCMLIISTGGKNISSYLPTNKTAVLYGNVDHLHRLSIKLLGWEGGDYEKEIRIKWI
jgi:hypothetical protein